MNDQLQNTLQHILDIKEDLRDALITRGVDVTGVPFKQWGDRLLYALEQRKRQAGGGGLGFNDQVTTSRPPPQRPLLPSLNPAPVTGQIASEELYSGPVFVQPAPYPESRRMGWMDAADSNPDGVWVNWILWSYAGTGSPPYTESVAVYSDETRQTFITNAVYSKESFYSLVDSSAYVTQSGAPMSAALVRKGLHAPIRNRNGPNFSPNEPSPNWERYPAYCYGQIYESWDGKTFNIDSVDRCALVSETSAPVN